MKDTLERLRTILETVPPRLRAISEAESVRRPAADKWSRKEILGHLIDSAANNHQRFVRGQLVRDLSTPDYAGTEWVEAERFQERHWNDLVELWIAYNKHLLHLMTHVPQKHRDAIIRIGDDQPASLEEVMIDYIRHLKHHLEQIGVSTAIE